MRNIDPSSEENQQAERDNARDAFAAKMQARADLQIDPEAFELETIEELIEEANQDSDPVSHYYLGTQAESYGAILIVKGSVAADKVYNLLCEQGLIHARKTSYRPLTHSP